MKITAIISMLLLNSVAWAQSDSTVIKFNYLEKDLALISEINNTQFLGISCSDQRMKGKTFLLSFDEYENGKIIKKDTSGLICNKQKMPIVMGKDTMYYMISYCDRMKFNKQDSIFKVRLAGKLEKDTFKLKIDYESIMLEKFFKGNKDYRLRELICSANYKATIKLNTLTPIMAYTPPFEMDDNSSSYCLLGTEAIDKWYEKFKIKHYFIINLKIE